MRKRNKAKTHVKKLQDNYINEIIREKEILKMIEEYSSNCFESKSNKTTEQCKEFLMEYYVPKRSEIDKKKL